MFGVRKAYRELGKLVRRIQQENNQLKEENAKLRELSARAWRLFTEHGAVHVSDLPEVDAVRDGLRELGVEP